MVKSFRAAISAAFLLIASPAYACAVLESATPKVGATVAGPVDSVTLTFSSRIYPDKSTMEVTDAHGTTVSTGNAHGQKDDYTIMAVTTRLPPGTYKVHWNVLCDCGSLTPGSYKFTVQ